MLKWESSDTKGVVMIVKDLEKMERIVKKYQELKWSGWDVLELKKNNLGRTDVNGVRINNQWYIQKTFSPSRNGWEIPSKYQE